MMAHKTGLTFIIFLVVTGKAEDERCFSKVSNEVDGACKVINITCPTGTVIYKPDIIASSENCTERYPISGHSPPCVGTPIDLAVDISSCFWKQTCLVRFPATPVFDKSAGKCHEPALSLRINTVKCIKIGTKQIYHNALCLDEMIGPKALSGVILSHTMIPWNYDVSSFKIISMETSGCSVNIENRLNSGTYTHIEVDFFDIDTDNDMLEINNVSVSGGYTMQSKPNRAVNIRFTTHNSKSKGGSGFVICFKKTERDFNNVSACDDVIVNGKATVVLATAPDDLCYEHFWPSEVSTIKTNTITDLGILTMTTPKPPKQQAKRNRKKCRHSGTELKIICKDCPNNRRKCRRCCKQNCPRKGKKGRCKKKRKNKKKTDRTKNVKRKKQPKN